MGMSRSSYAFGFALALGAGLALLHGCGQEPTEPPALRSLPSYRLTIGAGSSSAGGTIAASRGGISCTVVGATSASEVIGACNSAYPAGTIVSLTAVAAGGAVLKLDEEWGGTCEPNVEDHRVCQVTMDRDREVAADLRARVDQLHAHRVRRRRRERNRLFDAERDQLHDHRRQGDLGQLQRRIRRAVPK